MAEDPAYVAARAALLDALDALQEQLDSLVLVGAQAVYLRTGSPIAAVAPYTTDADLAVDPRALRPSPPLPQLLRAGSIDPDERPRRRQPGMWVRMRDVHGEPTPVPVELLVPERVAPPGGTRGARLGVHGDRTARKTEGLEACLVDRDRLTVRSLSPSDDRSFKVQVAGQAGLLIAKMHKLRDRLDGDREDRQSDKDAVDVYRILLATNSAQLTEQYATALASELSRPVALEGLDIARDLFSARGRPGVVMAARALAGFVPEQRIAAVCREGISLLGDADASD